mgnify:FL=1
MVRSAPVSRGGRSYGSEHPEMIQYKPFSSKDSELVAGKETDTKSTTGDTTAEITGEGRGKESESEGIWKDLLHSGETNFKEQMSRPILHKHKERLEESGGAEGVENSERVTKKARRILVGHNNDEGVS